MKKYVFLLLFLFSCTFYGQQTVFDGDPDEAFKNARELAFNGKRKQAQDTLLLILTKSPNYHDIRSFLATTYSWDGDYAKARKEFDYILKRNQKRLSTWEAAIKNELWGDAPSNALKLVNEGLKHFPNNTDLLYLKASALEDINAPKRALLIIEHLLEIDPEHKKATSFKNSLIQKLSLNTIGIRGSVEVYSDIFDPMQYYLLKYSRETKYGSIHGKVNFSRRFASNGFQFEIDLYPRIMEGLYAYLNVGTSESTLFPKVRFGAELYKSLPKSFEVSLGLRSLKYSETTNIYTGSVGWYTGNSYWSFRSYVTPDNVGSSMSGTLLYRKYGKDANNFFSIDAGMGFSPEVNRFRFEGDQNAIINLRSQKMNLGYSFSSKNDKHLWGIRSGVVHQELSFDPGSYIWIFDFGVTLNVRFK